MLNEKFLILVREDLIILIVIKVSKCILIETMCVYDYSYKEDERGNLVKNCSRSTILNQFLESSLLDSFVYDHYIAKQIEDDLLSKRINSNVLGFILKAFKQPPKFSINSVQLSNQDTYNNTEKSG